MQELFLHIIFKNMLYILLNSLVNKGTRDYCYKWVKNKPSQMWLHMPVIPDAQEAEMGGLWLEARLGKSSETPSQPTS
jgi:hypothetical protein